MENDGPIKRHEALQPYSRQHHHTLLLGWKIKTGITKNIDASRISSYVKWYVETHLQQHFKEEEAYIFPILGADNILITQALQEHKELEALFAIPHHNYEQLTQLAELLKNHIRFEERVLFNAIQQVATKAQLAVIDGLHEDHFLDNISDPFWL